MVGGRGDESERGKNEQGDVVDGRDQRHGAPFVRVALRATTDERTSQERETRCRWGRQG